MPLRGTPSPPPPPGRPSFITFRPTSGSSQPKGPQCPKGDQYAQKKISATKRSRQGLTSGGPGQARTSAAQEAPPPPTSGPPYSRSRAAQTASTSRSEPMQFDRLSGGGIGPAVPGAPLTARLHPAVGRRRRSTPGGARPDKAAEGPPSGTHRAPHSSGGQEVPHGHPQQHEAACASRTCLSLRARRQLGPPMQFGQEAHPQPEPRHQQGHRSQPRLSQPGEALFTPLSQNK
ncbi:proline-rich protein HaeIII subfamily 1-like [Pleurodeles waltl]|uniref:proline-rich protein HaeIII subfamily 1-like n=1 Tax=Pleurodeles waltl TaxID=8319 RepID=UPI003709BC30